MSYRPSTPVISGTTVYWHVIGCHDDGTVERVHDALRVKVRDADGRTARPSAGPIDSQSVRAADTGPKATWPTSG